ncbi:thiosulfate oxidation carrier protein SoxY [Mesorhizobium mediterraneum]|uniref:thiosulfate oxidation carrier protein SoxY n=1 Tax=Mesorhizobium mediterraneum TaxID=43617 RepID=UPI001782B9AC|nr:thiosulfate oxidation carrier protein SoxY [Mesorhizobium mediterraneum]
MSLTRRDVLIAGSVGFAGVALFSPRSARANDEALDLVKQLTGRTAIASDRLHLTMPAVFSTGYTVPMSLDVDSPMTEADHVRQIRVFAPQNPIAVPALIAGERPAHFIAHLCLSAKSGHWPSGRQISSTVYFPFLTLTIDTGFGGTIVGRV